MSRRAFFWTLNLLFGVQWGVMAFGVHDRSAWILENIILAMFMGPGLWLYVKGHMSKTSYFMLYLFVALHTVGAHYTYSEVPYNEWSKNLFGVSLNELLGFKRNHYDRFLHLLWGVLLYHPLKEIFYVFPKLKGAVLVAMTLTTLTSASAIYELVEWGAAVTFSEGTGMAFLGTQGDVWDAHKDQALALLGSIFASLAFYKFPLIEPRSKT